ncbi:Rieske 2Fe-2S domain-containing protein [Amycolatopsis sulphurea]
MTIFTTDAASTEKGAVRFMRALGKHSPFWSTRTSDRTTRPAENGAVPRLPYPDGWFAVAFRDELPPGRVLARRFLGEDVVLYRTRTGLLRAVRPFCPHLGAHLAHGGRIEGDDIVCPFHGFAFDPSGTCVRTGCGAPPPPNAQLTTWEVREIDSVILLWHHAQGHPPDWEVPATPAEGLCAPRHVVHTLNDHPQDILENGIDLGHFPPVHNIAGDNLRTRYTGNEMVINLDINPVEGGHVGLFGALGATLEMRLYGVGFAIARTYIPKLRARAQLWMLPTPIDPLHIELRIAGRIEQVLDRRPPAPVARLLSTAMVLFFDHDVSKDLPIWTNKTYLDRPKLIKGDGPIMEYRRWARQFYSERSPQVS